MLEEEFGSDTDDEDYLPEGRGDLGNNKKSIVFFNARMSYPHSCPQ
jgi:hypothetical protein